MNNSTNWRGVQFSMDVLSLAHGFLAETGKALRWRRGSVTLLYRIFYILGGERELVEMPHKDLAPLFSPASSDEAAVRKLQRAIDSLNEDQDLSRFRAVEIVPGTLVRGRGDSPDKYVPTKYKNVELYPVIDEIELKANQRELMKLPVRARNRVLRVVVQQICRERGYMVISREKVEREVEAKERAPCADPECAQCPIHCVESAAPDWRRLPYKERFDHVLQDFHDQMSGLISEADDYGLAQQIYDAGLKVFKMIEAGALTDKRQAVARFNQPRKSKI